MFFRAQSVFEAVKSENHPPLYCMCNMWNDAWRSNEAFNWKNYVQLKQRDLKKKGEGNSSRCSIHRNRPRLHDGNITCTCVPFIYPISINTLHIRWIIKLLLKVLKRKTKEYAELERQYSIKKHRYHPYHCYSLSNNRSPDNPTHPQSST